MGENPALPGRLAVRAPMQWTPYDTGGFSAVPPQDFVRPMPSAGEYGYERVNVASQRGDPDSLLNRLTALIRTRRECGEIGSGSCRIFETGSDAVLGLRYDDHQSAIVVLNNLSPGRHTFTLDLTERERETATDLVSDRPYEPVDLKSDRMRINGYGYRWLRLGGAY